MNKFLIVVFSFALFFWANSPLTLASESKCKKSKIPFQKSIFASRLFDSPSGKIIKDPLLFIANNKIVDLKTNCPHKILNWKPDIVLNNATLLPGLIDTHVHLSYEGPQRSHFDDSYKLLFEKAKKNAQLLLRRGFTTLRSMGQLVPRAQLIDADLQNFYSQTKTVAPTIVPSGHVLYKKGGGCDPHKRLRKTPHQKLTYKVGQIETLADIKKAILFQVRNGAKWIKICATGSVLSETDEVSPTEFSKEYLERIVLEAKKVGVPVAAHAHGVEGISLAVASGVRSLEHGSFINAEIVKKMLALNTYLVPTLYITDGAIDFDKLPPKMREKAKQLAPLAQKNIGLAFRNGVNIAFGSDAGAISHSETSKEFNSLVKFGLTKSQALQSATINAAKMLALEDRGVLKPGLTADIMAVQGNPLDSIADMAQVIFVMKAGRILEPDVTSK